MRICAFVHCTHSTYQLNKWKSKTCAIHDKFNKDCECPPPFTLHPFPTDTINRQQWIKTVNRKDGLTGKNWQPSADSRVCSHHFIDGKPTQENPSPLINLTPNVASTNSAPVVLKRKRNPPKERTTSTATKKARVESSSYEREASTIEFVIHDHDYTNTCSNETEHNNITCQGCLDKQSEIERLKKQLEKALNETDTGKMGTEDDSLLKTFIKNDSKVSFYTGLPNKKCFELLEKHLSGKAKKMRYWAGSKKVISSKYKKTTRQAKRGPQRKLSIKQEMLLTMMKLRHYLANELLADLFHVSTSTVSQIFNTWIKFLRKELSPLIYWPERESINQKLPDSVKKSHPNLRCTIDCTEIFIERPRDLKLRALTWSDYKKNNTVKFLVGIAPNGMINFLSKAWGGRTSDRHITIESGFLNKLEPGDLILADRGFTIREDILLRGATLTIPPPSSGLEQMTNKDVKATKVIANSRIHVERAIGRMKHFEIVNNTLSITLLPVIDDIVIVCACLCNLLPPLTGW